VNSDVSRLSVPSSPDATQRFYARLAGALFLINYALNIFGVATQETIRGTGDFAQAAERILSAEHLYRAALTSVALGWVTVVLLSFALYVVLEPVNQRLARLALYFRLGEAFVGGAGVLWSFAMLRLYTSADGAALVLAMRSAVDSGFFIAWSFLGPGSILFFYLFYKSGYIPRALAVLGVFGSVVMMIGNVVALIFPKYTPLVQYGWAPIGIAEIGTALWLVIVGVRAR
jgi:Domain of unknown function (DUF4386)